MFLQQSGKKMLHAVDARKNYYVKRCNVVERLIERLIMIRRLDDLNGRHLCALCAEFLQLHAQCRCLIARARDDYFLTEQRTRFKPLQLIAQLDHVADNEDRGRSNAFALHIISRATDRRDQRALIDSSAATNDGGGRFGIASVFNQPLRNFFEIGNAH